MQQQQQSPPQYSSTDMIKYGMMKNGSGQQIEFLVNLQDVLHQIYASLKGGHYDSKKKMFVVTPDGKGQVMSDEGINEIMGMLSRRLSRLFSVNKYTEQEISERMGIFTREIGKILLIKRRKWKLDREMYSWLVNELYDAVEAGFKRAQNGEIIDLIGDTSRTQQTQIIDNNRGSWFPLMRGGRKV